MNSELKNEITKAKVKAASTKTDIVIFKTTIGYASELKAIRGNWSYEYLINKNGEIYDSKGARYDTEDKKPKEEKKAIKKESPKDKDSPKS